MRINVNNFFKFFDSTNFSLFSQSFFINISAFFIYKLTKKKRHFRKIATVFLILGVVLYCSVLEIYPYQPLVPKIRINENYYYVTDFREIVTAYQRDVILFLNEFNDDYLAILHESILWTGYGLINISKQRLLSRMYLEVLEHDNELSLPAQTIVVIPINLGKVRMSYKNALYLKKFWNVNSVIKSITFSNGVWGVLYIH